MAGGSSWLAARHRFHLFALLQKRAHQHWQVSQWMGLNRAFLVKHTLNYMWEDKAPETPERNGWGASLNSISNTISSSCFLKSRSVSCTSRGKTISSRKFCPCSNSAREGTNVLYSSFPKVSGIFNSWKKLGRVKVWKKWAIMELHTE